MDLLEEGKKMAGFAKLPPTREMAERALLDERSKDKDWPDTKEPNFDPRIDYWFGIAGNERLRAWKAESELKELEEEIGKPKWSCPHCGNTNQSKFKTIKYDGNPADPVDYDLECMECGALDATESPEEALALVADELQEISSGIFYKPRHFPKVVCLCGSTRFTNEMLIKQWEFTKQGKVVLSWCALPSSYDSEPHIGDREGVKELIDEVHKRKIDLADEVFVINVGGYIGESTRSEIEYAIAHDKPVFYLEPIEEKK